MVRFWKWLQEVFVTDNHPCRISMKSSIWNIRDTIRTNEGVKELSKFVEKDGMKKLAYKINSIKGHINQEKFPPWVIIPLMYKQENHRIKQVILALKD